MFMSKSKLAKLSLLALFILFAGAQFVGPSRTNPPVVAAQTLASRVHVTPEAQAILDRSCKDCHSHQTEWPWYSRVAPASWYVVDHVNHGRRHLNFSRWSRYDRDDAEQLLTAICKTAKGGSMPLPSYTRLHREAELSAEDVRALCDWTSDARRHLALQSAK